MQVKPKAAKAALPAITDDAFRKMLDKDSVKFILSHTFFAQLFYGTDTVIDRTIPTAGTTGEKKYYNPEFYASLPPDQRLTLNAHEVMHDALEHPFRRGGRDMKRWNIACDFEVNAILMENKFAPIPGYWLYNKDWHGKTAEWIYNQLPEDDGEGDQGLQDVQDFQGDVDEREEAISKGQARVINAARTTEKTGGSMPGFAERLLDKIKNPKMHWADELREFFTVLSRDDYDFTKLDRIGYLKTYCIQPKLYSEKIDEIVIAVDWSGSITQAQVDTFASHLNAILEDVRPQRTVVLHFDHGVRKVEEFTADDFPVNLKVQAGGGTAFEPIFAKIKGMGLAPKVCIVLTDTYGSCACDEPPYPVIWGNTEGPTSTLPFGTTLHVVVEE